MVEQQSEQTVTCEACAQQVVVPVLSHRQKASCPRCGVALSQYNRRSFEHIAALAMSSLMMLMLALPFEFLAFSAKGQQHQINLLSSISTLANNDYLLLAMLLLLAIFAIPLSLILGLLYLTLPTLSGARIKGRGQVLELVLKLVPWSMAEIFLIAILVSLVKISDIADVTLGPSFYAYLGFTLLMTLTISQVDKLQFQQALNVSLKPRPVDPVCIQHTWALLITAAILYIPASTLPIMNTRLLGQDTPSTIYGGVVVLWQHGSYLVASIIFVASIVVPVAKLLVIGWLNYSVQYGDRRLRKGRTWIYRITEFIGRWSMIDVFVVAILVSLIQLGNTMSVYPGKAALAFCGVVIITMLAAITFDARLIWNTEHKHGKG